MEIIYFSAPWCQPCVEYRPLVESVLTEYPDVTVKHVNIDNDFNLAWQHKVTEIPALVVEGQPKLIGKAKDDELRSWLNTVTRR